MPNRSNRAAHYMFISISVFVVALSASFILLYLFKLGSSNTLQPPNDAAKVISDSTPIAPIPVPAVLKIDKINVDAVVTPVGLTPEGDMDIDENATQVAWYKLGPKPGEEGSAVIAGHYGWKDGVASVFNDLSTLTKGDEISTVGEDGKVFTFVVTRTKIYDPEQDATEVFRSDDSKAHLNLITCQGSWNNTLATYSERLVVFSDFVR